MVVKTGADLHDFVNRILVAAGASEQNAHRVAETLVSSNLCGVDTQGNWTFGHVTAQYATGVAIQKARDQHMAIVGWIPILWPWAFPPGRDRP